MKLWISCAVLGLVGAGGYAQIADSPPAEPERPSLPLADKPFVQEYRTFLPSTGSESGDDIRGLTLDGRERLWCATSDGVWVWDGAVWARAALSEPGPVYAVQTDSEGRIWVGAWNGLYRSTENGTALESLLTGLGPISVVYGHDTILAAGPEGLWRIAPGGVIQSYDLGGIESPRALAPTEAPDVYWLGTDVGLFRIRLPVASIPGTLVEIEEHLTGGVGLSSGEVTALNSEYQQMLFVGGMEGIDLIQGGAHQLRLDPTNGLASRHVRSLEVSPFTTGVPTPYLFGTSDFDINPETYATIPAVTLWVATPKGAARFLLQRWSLLHGERWLPSDDVRGFAFDEEGNTYVGTAKGVSVIGRRLLTLAEKAEHYHRIVRERKVREPGLVEKTRLLTRGDITTSSYEDDDNDGEYTAMYLMSEAYRYRATGAEDARVNAQAAYEALEFLQTVTDTEGFVARTVVPYSWGEPANPNPHRFHDRNQEFTPQQIAERRVADPRNKTVEERWRLSKDGKWYWKGDTSSDEIVGHFCGYLFYHELVAETPEEKARVAGHVARIMDYIIDGGLTLRDIDGVHTKWGVWSPEKLLAPGEWQAERHINATEILSFLLVTHHLTGDEKYLTVYDDLVENHGYLELARAPQITDPENFTHIDSILLAMTFPGLLMTEGRPEHKEAFLEGLNQWFPYIRDEWSPYYNFLYGAFGEEDFLAPECVSFLRDAPLDLVRWRMDNSVREDVQLVRSPERDHWQTSRMLPPSERAMLRWDKNPWSAVQGDGGHTESSGVYWLLPYWMGRYYGFIAAPDEE